jgi:zinc protease
VQTDRTADSVAEILREITEIRTTNPPSKAELHRVQRSNTLSLSGRWETNPAVLASIAQIISYGLPEDYWDTYPELLNALTVEQVTAAGQSTIDPADLTWVVIGDRARIEAELRELELGEIQLLDVDGNPVAADD